MFPVRPITLHASPVQVRLPRGPHASMLCFLLLLLFGLSTSAVAQTGQGSINGRVTDPHGALIAKAQVTVTNVETQEKHQTRTNGSGAYNVEALNPGTYTVEVSAAGFQTTLIDKVLVSTAQAVETNARLPIGNESISVTVTSQDSLLSKATDVSTTVDHALVENLPYPERSALEAVLLVPGIEGDPTQPGGIATENPGYLTGQVTPGASIRIGGAPPGTHAHLIDGSDVVQSSFGRSGLNLSGRAVQETTAITTGLSAKYGRTGTGVIIQTTRTGTDQLHGTLSYRHTDPFFNAYPLGGNAPNDNHQNLFGASLGGPVLIPKIYTRHGTFFNVDVEPARLRNLVSARGIFYTTDQLAGREYNGPSIYYHSTVNSQGFPNGPDSSSKYAQITGPLADCGPTFIAANPTATVCPNDLVPQLAQNPFAQFVLSYEPTPANPGPYVFYDNPDGSFTPGVSTNASYLRGVYNTDTRYNIRIDHQIDQRSQIYVRYSTIPILATRFFILPQTNPLSQAPTDSTVSKDIAIGYTRVLSNNLVANFRYSFLRVNQQRLENSYSTSQDFAAKFGLTPATAGVGFPNLGSFTSSSSSTTYTIKPGSQTPFTALDQNFIVGQDFNYTRGAHLFQFGGEYRWIESNQDDLEYQNGGIYNFSPTQTANGNSSTGTSLATFILGTVSSYQNAPQNITAYYRWHYYAFYLQDDWRVTSKLTANIGVRYNSETPRMEKNNNQGSIVLQPGSLNGVAAQAGFCFSGTCGLPNTLWPTNHLEFEPRVGLAYSISPKVVLRGSYSLSHLPLTGYGNMQLPNLGLGSKVSSTTGGLNPGNIVNYISNPIVTPVSGYSLFNQQRGSPVFSSDTIQPVYVSQSTRVPYIQSWSASVQYQPTPKSVVQVTYQGSLGVHLIGAFNEPLNLIPLAKLRGAVQSQADLTETTPNSYHILNSATLGYPTPSVITETVLQSLTPFQNFFNQDLNEIYPRGGSLKYNALYVSFNQRFNRHVTVLASYSWSKTLDNIPDVTAGTAGGGNTADDQVQDDPRSDYSLASFDYPSRFRTGFHVALPFGRTESFRTHFRPLDMLLENITTSGILTSASGHPNNVTLGTNGFFDSITPNGVNGCGAGAGKFCSTSALPDGYVLRPDIVPGVPLINKNWRSNPFNLPGKGPFTPYLNVNAFATPGSQGNPQLGNAPRNLGGGRTPREFLFDARVGKAIKIREHYELRLTATALNVFNHPVYFNVSDNSSGTVNDSTSTGQITTGLDGSFGNLNQGASGGLSRTLFVGAQFSF